MQNRLAVLGSPISHSKSPAIHRAAYDVLGLDWDYGRFDVTEDALHEFMASRGPEWRAFSLTMPLKYVAHELADELDATARVTGAVNTLLIHAVDGEKKMSGFNTDVAGIVRSLAENGIKRASHVLVLGGGATAGSAIMAAAELGAVGVCVAVRTPAKAEGLRLIATAAGVTLDIVPLADATAAASVADLLINTLPGGTKTGLTIEADVIRRVPLYEVAYAPWPGELGAQWLAADGRVISGIGMLLHQALVQVRIFVNGDPFAPLPNEPEVFAAMSAAALS